MKKTLEEEKQRYRQIVEQVEKPVDPKLNSMKSNALSISHAWGKPKFEENEPHNHAGLFDDKLKAIVTEMFAELMGNNMRSHDARNEIQHKLENILSDVYNGRPGGVYNPNKESEISEGNAFSGAAAKAKEEGKDTFEIDGKTYNVK